MNYKIVDNFFDKAISVLSRPSGDNFRGTSWTIKRQILRDPNAYRR